MLEITLHLTLAPAASPADPDSGPDAAATPPPGPATAAAAAAAARTTTVVSTVRLKFAGERLDDLGDAQRWRLSRLRWLDSGLGHTALPPAPFGPVSYVAGHGLRGAQRAARGGGGSGGGGGGGGGGGEVDLMCEAVAIYELCNYTGLGSREGDVYLA